MNKEIAALAAKVLKTDAAQVIGHCREISEIGGWYFWNPEKGGLSVLISSGGEKLAATSGVSLARHIEAFKSGRRN